MQKKKQNSPADEWDERKKKTKCVEVGKSERGQRSELSASTDADRMAPVPQKEPKAVAATHTWAGGRSFHVFAVCPPSPFSVCAKMSGGFPDFKERKLKVKLSMQIST